MSIYKHYVIKSGEDLRTIAQKLYGNPNLWVKLASLNHLKTPYIVGSEEELAKDPDHLKMWGQYLILPNDTDVYRANSALIEESNTAHYKDAYYDTVLGMDLKLDISTDVALTEQLGVLDDNGRTFETVSGIHNLKQSLILRILTRRGTLMLHPNYGSNIPNMIGKNINHKLVRELAVELRRTITTDSRVADCVITEAKANYNEVYLVASVTPINYNEAFDLYLFRSQSGELSLR